MTHDLNQGPPQCIVKAIRLTQVMQASELLNNYHPTTQGIEKALLTYKINLKQFPNI